MDNSAGQLQTDSGRYEIGQIPVSKNVHLIAGMVTEPIINSSDGTASFVKIIRLYPGNQQRNFEEARGLAINDYQGYLEEKWIAQLKQLYPVKINQQVFGSITN